MLVPVGFRLGKPIIKNFMKNSKQTDVEKLENILDEILKLTFEKAKEGDSDASKINSLAYEAKKIVSRFN